MAEIKAYNTIEGEAGGEIVEKKSRFIGYAVHVESEEEAMQIVESVKKKYYDARHNCYVFICGEGGERFKFSDDGEPSGTAGKPMMEILKGRELTNILVIVTRYFGGVLLGTGGLVRAYSDATVAALEAADIITMAPMVQDSITVDYTLIGKIKYIFNELNVVTINEEYGADVTIEFAVPVDNYGRLRSQLTECTLGKINLDSEQMHVVYLKS